MLATTTHHDCTNYIGVRTSSSSFGVIFLKTGPSSAIPPGVNIPHCFAIAEAVWILSPEKE